MKKRNSLVAAFALAVPMAMGTTCNPPQPNCEYTVEFDPDNANTTLGINDADQNYFIVYGCRYDAPDQQTGTSNLGEYAAVRATLESDIGDLVEEDDVGIAVEDEVAGQDFIGFYAGSTGPIEMNVEFAEANNSNPLSSDAFPGDFDENDFTGTVTIDDGNGNVVTGTVVELDYNAF